MDSNPQKQSSGHGGYGDYSYGGYGYGAEQAVHRSFRDYTLILRERIWYIIVVFLVVFSSVLVYTFSQTKIYQSVASVQVLRSDPSGLQRTQEITRTDVVNQDDLNTVVDLFKSTIIIQNVAQRITGDDLRQFMAPYEKEKDGDEPVTPLQILALNREIAPNRMSLFVNVSYRHPNRFIAAKVANLFVSEFIAYNTRTRIDQAMRVVEDLKVKAEQQEEKVNALAKDLQNYRVQHNMVSLKGDRTDIVAAKLQQLNINVTTLDAALADAQVRWQQVQALEAAHGDLTQLAFISNQTNIAQLMQTVSNQQILVAQLSKRYRPAHPVMIQNMNQLAQSQAELDQAVKNAAQTIELNYQNCVANSAKAHDALKQGEDESMQLGSADVDYQALLTQWTINQGVLDNLVTSMRQASLTISNSQNVQPVDQATPAAEGRYVSPRIALYISLGFVGGIALGLGFAFFVAFIDDRVKSSFDIESVVGLPLVGIIPQVKKMEQPDKAQIAINNADRQVAESFLAVHSGLRLKDESKNAKCILVTSTVPGEGKSFTVTNLALTFAAHGERVVIVDCDLRKPNIHKSFRLENRMGIIDVCGGSATIDDVLLRNVHPNLDIIPTGGRAKNPTQILNGKNFEAMIADLRKRYDRIFLDTPPLAAVSDALIVLPLVDGSIFTIFFNKVRRKAAQFSAKKLLETNVPVFGAILNGLNLTVAGYYYAQYYDKSYKDYYVVAAKDDPTPER